MQPAQKLKPRQLCGAAIVSSRILRMTTRVGRVDRGGLRTVVSSNLKYRSAGDGAWYRAPQSGHQKRPTFLSIIAVYQKSRWCCRRKPRP
jgi:hypothetical protein